MNSKKCLISVVLSSLIFVSGLFANNLQPWKVNENEVLFSAITKNGNSGYIMKSLDGGHNWEMAWDSEMDAQSTKNRLQGIAYDGKGTVVAVGNIILASKDKGMSWEESTLYRVTGANVFGSTSGMLKSVAYGNGLFVAAAKYNVIYSKDGINWKFVRTGKLSLEEQRSKENPSGLSLEDIKKDPKLHAKRPSIGEFPPDISPSIKNVTKVTFVKDRFLVTGGQGGFEGAFFKVKNGELVLDQKIDFKSYGNRAKLNTGGGQGVAYDGDSTIVMVSNSTKSAFSLDLGKSWKFMYQPGKQQAYAVVHHNGQWTALSPFRNIYSAQNIKKKWKEVKGSIKERAVMRNIIYANDRYIAMGNDSVVLVSQDGVNWQSANKKKEFGMNSFGIVFAKFK